MENPGVPQGRTRPTENPYRNKCPGVRIFYFQCGHAEYEKTINCMLAGADGDHQQCSWSKSKHPVCPSCDQANIVRLEAINKIQSSELTSHMKHIISRDMEITRLKGRLRSLENAPGANLMQGRDGEKANLKARLAGLEKDAVADTSETHAEFKMERQKAAANSKRQLTNAKKKAAADLQKAQIKYEALQAEAKVCSEALKDVKEALKKADVKFQTLQAEAKAERRSAAADKIKGQARVRALEAELQKTRAMLALAHAEIERLGLYGENKYKEISAVKKKTESAGYLRAQK